MIAPTRPKDAGMLHGVSLEQVGDALEYISPDNPTIRQRVGEALKTTFQDRGLTLWMDWASEASLRHCDSNVMSLWRSISGRRNIGYIIGTARSNGWKPAKYRNTGPELEDAGHRAVAIVNPMRTPVAPSFSTPCPFCHHEGQGYDVRYPGGQRVARCRRCFHETNF